MGTIVTLFIFVLFAVVGGLVAHNVSSSSKKKEDITRHQWSAGDSLEHGDCKPQVGDSCLHQENITESDVKACSKCGYKNEKSARKCSVCGKRLW